MVDERNAPKFGTVMTILVLPVLLICLDTVLNTLAVAGLIDGKTALVEFLRMLGKTPVALLITLIVCLAVFAKDYGMAN